MSDLQNGAVMFRQIDEVLSRLQAWRDRLLDEYMQPAPQKIRRYDFVASGRDGDANRINQVEKGPILAERLNADAPGDSMCLVDVDVGDADKVDIGHGGENAGML